MSAPFGSLTGTLEGDQLLLQMDALAKQQQEALARSTQSAQGQAQQAGQAYTQAAAQPAPTPDAFGALLNTLGGGVASVLQGNQAPAQRAEQRNEQSRAQLLKQRADNLQALGQVYQQKAEEAQKAGDLETTEKYRRQFETLNKQFELVRGNQKRAQDLEDKKALNEQEHGFRMQEIGARTAGDIKVKQTPTPVAGMEDTPWLQRLVRKTTDDVKWIPIGGLTGKARNTAIIKAGELGIPALDRADTKELGEVQIARMNQKKMYDQIVQFLPPDWQSRPESIPNIAFSQFLKSNKLVAAFGAWRENAIQQLKATAGITGNRQAQKQFDLVLKNDIPQVGLFFADPLPVALQRMDNVNAMLQSRQDALLNPDLSDSPAYNGAAPPGYVPVTKGSASKAPAPPPGFPVTAPNGKTYHFTSKQSADVFKKRAGIK
jgi:hypothetical protein